MSCRHTSVQLCIQERVTASACVTRLIGTFPAHLHRPNDKYRNKQPIIRYMTNINLIVRSIFKLGKITYMKTTTRYE